MKRGMLKRFAAALVAAVLMILPITAGAQEVKIPSVPLAAGFLHSAYIDGDGVLWIAGDNTYGQVGRDAAEASGTEKNGAFIRVMDNARAVFSGYLSNLVIDSEGTLYGFGWNEGSQLGTGDKENQLTPVVIMNDVVTADISRFHAAAVSADGTLWTWGWNMAGQLGLDHTENTEMRQPALTEVRSVSLGVEHTMAIKNDDTLWAAGDNTYGQLGDGTVQQRNAFVQVMEDVQQVACTSFGTLILKKDGTLLTVGYNGKGAMGDGTTIDVGTPKEILRGVRSIAAGESTAAAIDTQGNLLVWGENTYGQYGPEESFTPLQVAEGVSDVALGGGQMLYLTEDGVVHGLGNNEKQQLVEDEKAENVSQVQELAQGVIPAAVQESRQAAENTAALWIGIGVAVAVVVLFTVLIVRTVRGKKKPDKPAKVRESKPEKEKKASDKELIAAAAEMAKQQEAKAQAAEKTADAAADNVAPAAEKAASEAAGNVMVEAVEKAAGEVATSAPVPEKPRVAEPEVQEKPEAAREVIDVEALEDAITREEE